MGSVFRTLVARGDCSPDLQPAETKRLVHTEKPDLNIFAFCANKKYC